MNRIQPPEVSSADLYLPAPGARRDLGTAGGTESQGNAVRLMTIHKSKGWNSRLFCCGIIQKFQPAGFEFPFPDA